MAIHNSSSNKVTALALYSMLFLMFFLTGLIGYALLFHNQVPFSIQGPIEIISEEPVSPGEQVFTRVSYCSNTHQPITLYRQIAKDTFWLEMPTVQIVPDYGCHTIETAFTTPNILPDGIYHVSYTSEVQVNPLANRVSRFDTEPFEVVCDPECE